MRQRVVEEYLEAKGSTLWGRAFDVNDPESRGEAARWLLREMNGVLRYAQRKEVYG